MYHHTLAAHRVKLLRSNDFVPLEVLLTSPLLDFTTEKKKRKRMDDHMKSCPKVYNENRQYEGLTLVEGDVPLSTPMSRSPPVFKQSSGSV